MPSAMKKASTPMKKIPAMKAVKKADTKATEAKASVPTKTTEKALTDEIIEPVKRGWFSWLFRRSSA